MSALTYYREQAALARAQADAEPLPQRRQQHQICAERWEEMALRAEELEQRTEVNAQERRERPYHQTLRSAYPRR